MAGLTLLALLQTGAIIYLIYRVHRLEQVVSGGRPGRRANLGDGERKVIPLLKEHVAPGPFRRKHDPSPTDPKK